MIVRSKYGEQKREVDGIKFDSKVERRDAKGYEGKYMISNMGDVKSLSRTILRRGKYPFVSKEFILKPHKGTSGYYAVNLTKNGKQKIHWNHKLVVNSFVDKIDGKLIINHKDGNKLNNCVSNLERCDYSDNLYHAYELGLRKSGFKGKIGILNHNSISINQYDLLGKFIRSWDSICDVRRDLGIPTGNISQCCKKRRNKAGGFIWKYNDE